MAFAASPYCPTALALGAPAAGRYEPARVMSYVCVFLKRLCSPYIPTSLELVTREGPRVKNFFQTCRVCPRSHTYITCELEYLLGATTPGSTWKTPGLRLRPTGSASGGPEEPRGIRPAGRSALVPYLTPPLFCCFLLCHVCLSYTWLVFVVRVTVLERFVGRGLTLVVALTDTDCKAGMKSGPEITVL